MFLNLSARAFLRVGVVAGMGNRSVSVLVVIGSSGERLGWAGSGMGKETIGGVIVDSEGFGSLAPSRTGGRTNSFLGSFADFSTYRGRGN